MKKIMFLLLIITLMVCNCFSVLADEIPTPPVNQISDDPNYSSVSIFFPIEVHLNEPMITGEDGLQLIYVQGSISKRSSAVDVTTTTTANLICWDIGAFVVIERWINNQWTMYSSFSNTAHNVSTTSNTRTVDVESGYYYRVRATHFAISEYSTKFGYTTTKSVFVN